MFEVHPDWTFAKLLEVSLQTVPQSEWLNADGDEPVCELRKEMNAHSDEPVCELRKEMNAHSAELVQVPLQFIIDQCCRVNGSFVRYLYPSTSQSIPLPFMR